MPELPEVELVARSLDKFISGRTIGEAALMRQRLAPRLLGDEFSRLLDGAGIICVRRRGKYILFRLDNDRTLVTHLRMSGRFLLLTQEKSNPEFTHAVFSFTDGTRLAYQDQRHFGYMNIVPTAELNQTPELRTLAPEPFSGDFSLDYFYQVLRTSRRSLKDILLDQTKVCGLGNIYAAEAMFLAGIHPAKIAKRLSRGQSGLLREKVITVLTEAIEAGSTLNVDPENVDGSFYSGGYVSRWRVYDRENLPCPACATSILRLRQSGRSSYFCPKCQRK